MDEVKITVPSPFQLFHNRHLQPDIVQHLSSEPPGSKSFRETIDWTISGPTGQCPDFESWPNGRFLREFYMYLYTSNGSLLLAFEFSC
jgi:hypothetical protein